MTQPIQDNPSKAQEVEHLTAFIESLPRDCYLRSYLRDTIPQFENMIRNDIVIPHRETVENASRELDHRSTQLAQVNAQLADAARQLVELQNAKRVVDGKLTYAAGVIRDIIGE